MTDPLRIALIMQGGRDWIGGVEYIKNIILALDALPSAYRSAFRVYLIDTQSFDFVYPYVDHRSRRRPYRSAAWIYDFQHKYLPHLFSTKEIEKRDKIFAHIAKYADTVVLNSRDVEADFHKFFPESRQKSRVVPYKICFPSSIFESIPQKTQEKYHLPDKFFLISNQFWQHKNHMLVFEALKLLGNDSIHPSVVCTGHVYDSRQPEYSDRVLRGIHALGLGKQVFLLGLIPKSDQIHLMRRALAVIQPSLFESWNIGVEEARALGKPMVLSDLPSHLEQSPPDSVFFERTSCEKLAGILADWWHHLSPGPDLDRERVARGAAPNSVRDFGRRFLRLASGQTISGEGRDVP
jgi:glycosyltransferase involved in cell wall biosynthesis